MDVLREVKAIISKQVGVPIDQLTPETKLEFIGVESVDVIEIIFALEEKFEISIPFNANEPASSEFDTIGQVANAVADLARAKMS